ncbi:MAG: hypothetical protein OHK0022_05650 [Roseiflexaceae bacterium]
MPDFEQEPTVKTSEGAVLVAAGLKPGRYLFELVIVDDEGNPSEPDRQVVEVLDPSELERFFASGDISGRAADDRSSA